MKIIFLLLITASCASKLPIQKLTLELENKTYEFTVKEENENIIISMPEKKQMNLKSTKGTGYVQGAFFGDKDIENKRWYLDELTGKSNSWVYSIFLTAQDSKMGKRITSATPISGSGIYYSKCVKETNNKYFISFMLGDLAGLYVGCVK